MKNINLLIIISIILALALVITLATKNTEMITGERDDTNKVLVSDSNNDTINQGVFINDWIAVNKKSDSTFNRNDDSDVSVTSINERDGCAQENYGKRSYCSGLEDGDKVPSCDLCNMCSCKTLPSENYLLPTCTEMAC